MNLQPKMFLYILFILSQIGTSLAATPATRYESNIIFFGFNDRSLATSSFVSTFNSLIRSKCNVNGLFTIIVHAEGENRDTPWVYAMIKKFLHYRGGCVFLMDYGYYAKSNSLVLHSHFDGIVEVLKRKMQQIGAYNRQLCFGSGFGARLCVAAGKAIGNSVIDRMELCDPSRTVFNNGFDPNPKPAAKNVACINTSSDLGTSTYNCHQNFRMGLCGRSQPAAGPPPLNSHGLCPYFYILAFNNNFVPNNVHKCTSTRLATMSSAVKMGYNARFNRTLVRGDVFIATAKHIPFIVKNGIIDNQMTAMMDYINRKI
ncbi:hypothetical protein Bhyg_04759 [Pseudolycoriella hygida]|uniref:Lipase domain-containing protein n=1 Tax=Pseudolycoriella hygida TaxID=35572 RepID=A0A9Q0S9U6_9DIPT|nr:hypothetical protein Bhyg_04759 [Pseudolycoriella hygida]